jgi:hypothetical protein
MEPSFDFHTVHALTLARTSRHLYRAFVRHFRVILVIGQIVSNHVIHVKSCHSCRHS